MEQNFLMTFLDLTFVTPAQALLFISVFTTFILLGVTFCSRWIRWKARDKNYFFTKKKLEIVYRIAYRSKLNNSCDINELIAYTQQFRRFNNQRGITGVMFLNKIQREVFQIVEGPHDDVLDLLDRICRDKRHIVDEKRVIHEPFVARTYTVWNMACHNFPIVDTMNSSLLWGCLMARTKMMLAKADWNNNSIPPMMEVCWITTQEHNARADDLPFRTTPVGIKQLSLDRIGMKIVFTVPREPDGSQSQLLQNMCEHKSVTISFLPEFANEHFRVFFKSRHPECVDTVTSSYGYAGSPKKNWYEGDARTISGVDFSEAGFHFTPVVYEGINFAGVFPAAKCFFTTVQSYRSLYTPSTDCRRRIKEELVVLDVRAVGLDDHIRW